MFYLFFQFTIEVGVNSFEIVDFSEEFVMHLLKNDPGLSSNSLPLREEFMHQFLNFCELAVRVSEL